MQVKTTQKITSITWNPESTKLCFFSVICRTNSKDINGMINETNSHLENYCKQQNLGFINNKNINKSDLAAKDLHLKEPGSSKLKKNFIEYTY